MPQIKNWGSTHKLTIVLGVLVLIFLISTVVLAIRVRDSCSPGTLCLRVDDIQAEVQKLMRRRSIRLPRNVIPKNYNLTLRPNLSTKLFDGFIIIHVKVVQSTNKILFHASRQLNISNITVKHHGGELAQFQNVTPDDTDVIDLHLPEIISPDDYEISVAYSGNLDKKIVGFYASNLKNGGTMVASKFQPTYTRQAFPCFDEPDFKATFDITLVKPATHIALSNMNELSSKHDEATNTDAVTFKRSVPMSTYLACFVICEFDFKETAINSNGVGRDFILRSYAQKGEMHKIDFAQSVARRALEFYIQYYQVPFPLPKMDMIAIPDYQSGATEHWGLITYRETSFLIDEMTAAAHNKLSVAGTIAHELAHMWFGNLVTNKWWDDLWLNEGFATYMQNKCLNDLEPSWTMMDQFLTKTLHSVLVTDAKLSSHSIVQKVETPDEITAIFDAISYNKGSSVIRMLEGFVGEERFRRGVTDYLNKFEFGNTVTQDLLDSLEPYFKTDNPTLSLSYIMDTWTRQTGYPVLSVKPGDGPNTLVLTQTRFLLDPEATYNKDDSPFGYRWFVPITYKTNRGPSETIVWFPDKADSVTITLKDGDEWFKINNNQVGFYRVNYTVETWRILIEQLKKKSKELTISDRAHLINDAFALAEARHLPYSQSLDLLTYITVEDQYVPWETAASVLRVLESRLLNSQGYGDLQKFVQHLIMPLYSKQSWDNHNSTVIGSLLQTRILRLATRFSLPEAKSKVRGLFLKWLNSHGTDNVVEIDPELRSLVYNYGMESATDEDWEKMWKIYLDCEDAQEKLKLRSALTTPKNTVLLTKFLNLAWEETNVRGQDYLNVLQSISANPSGAALVWDHVRANWQKLVERFTLNSRYLGNMIPAITNSFNTELKLKEMEAFFAQYPEAGAGETARRRALETCKNDIKWTKYNEQIVTEWLHNYVMNL